MLLQYVKRHSKLSFSKSVQLHMAKKTRQIEGLENHQMNNNTKFHPFPPVSIVLDASTPSNGGK